METIDLTHEFDLGSVVFEHYHVTKLLNNRSYEFIDDRHPSRRVFSSDRILPRFFYPLEHPKNRVGSDEWFVWYLETCWAQQNLSPEVAHSALNWFQKREPISQHEWNSFIAYRSLEEADPPPSLQTDCVICQTNKSNCAFIPCGHVCICR